MTWYSVDKQTGKKTEVSKDDVAKNVRRYYKSKYDKVSVIMRNAMEGNEIDTPFRVYVYQ